MVLKSCHTKKTQAQIKNGPYIVKNHPGKTIFDLCPDPGWLDTHHAPAEEVEYINRKLKELGMAHGAEELPHKEDPGTDQKWSFRGDSSQCKDRLTDQATRLSSRNSQEPR